MIDDENQPDPTECPDFQAENEKLTAAFAEAMAGIEQQNAEIIKLANHINGINFALHSAGNLLESLQKMTMQSGKENAYPIDWTRTITMDSIQAKNVFLALAGMPLVEISS
jgi:hypothetical protein